MGGQRVKTKFHFMQVQKLLSDGGGVEERYMSETITHAIADDCEADDYSEAKELFELTVVTVSFKYL